jgi:regulator of protease activity HflC (stomatin/prohibitin superfamily)
VITRDNVSVKVNAVLYFKVRDPSRAILEIEDFLFATSQLAQTTLRSVIGQAELDELLAEREKFNRILQRIIDEGTDLWGIDVTAVEVKDVDLPQEMKRAMARQAEAERERRAKVINAEGELQAASRLKDAAKLLSLEPASLQLRFLQTASEIAAENNSTTLFPLPIDLFMPFRKMLEERKELTEEERQEIKALEARAQTSADEATGLSMPSRISGAGDRSDLLGEGPAGVGAETDEAEAVRIKRGKADE